MQFSSCSLLILSFLLPTTFVPCLWDDDTIEMERNKFPEANELIAGYFVRHTVEYYQWRIDQLAGTDQQDWTTTDFDNVAVAYEKLGQHEKAIELIEAKIQRFPEQDRYQSEANLGTFLIHVGRFEEGLQHIQAAIKINPDAHFGREIYQQYLVQYILLKQQNKDDPQWVRQHGFSWFVFEQTKAETEDDRYHENRKAIKGIMGMMRFGNFQSPVLLEALGDLLMQDSAMDLRSDAKKLAARAFLRAAEFSSDEKERERLKSSAEFAVDQQHDQNLDHVAKELEQEVAKGNALFAQIAADEKQWVQSGKDVADEFTLKYFNQPWNLSDTQSQSFSGSFRLLLLLSVSTFMGLIGLAVIFAIRAGRNRSMTEDRLHAKLEG